MGMEKLNEAEIDAFLTEHPRWERQGDALRCSLQYRDFIEAFSEMARGALISERLNHHPEWTNVYSRLSIVLSTHDAGGITSKDLAWIEAFENK